jgi:hypothetical protein
MSTPNTRQSSLVVSQSYDEQSEALTVQLTSGGTYLYREVSAEIYGQFIGSESLGRAFNQFIRNLPCERLS